MAKEKENLALEAADAAAEKATKKQKKEKPQQKKQNAVSKWFHDLKSEFKKVVWPSKQTVINNSIVVFTAMIGFAIFTFLLDEAFLKLLELAISGNS